MLDSSKNISYIYQAIAISPEYYIDIGNPATRSTKVHFLRYKRMTEDQQEQQESVLNEKKKI